MSLRCSAFIILIYQIKAGPSSKKRVKTQKHPDLSNQLKDQGDRPPAGQRIANVREWVEISENSRTISQLDSRSGLRIKDQAHVHVQGDRRQDQIEFRVFVSISYNLNGEHRSMNRSELIIMLTVLAVGVCIIILILLNGWRSPA